MSSANFNDLRSELKEYYNESNERAKRFYETCTKILDDRYEDGMSVYRMKSLQYDVITDEFEPVLFLNSPFYYETGTMAGICDGARSFRGHLHAGGWTYWKNSHYFVETDRELWDRRNNQSSELLYLICGPFNDTSQHFLFNYRPIFEKGLKGVYEDAKNKISKENTAEENGFLNCVCEGLLAVKKIAEKFSLRAEKLLKNTKGEVARANLSLIAETAKRVPWEKPETFYEALNTYALMRKVIGSLEGIGPNSFGRVDVDLYPFYSADLEAGRLTEEKAYELICEFLITWDCHYDHDMKMVSFADHELENTYVLGGCDADGNPVYNELTEMFLRATREEDIIYPKVKCRFSENSPKEYLDAVDKSVIKGTSTVLYQNDDSCIPALVRAGFSLREARDYLVSGCWDLSLNGTCKHDSGNYLNLLKAFEFSLHNLKDKMEKVGIDFLTIDDATSFEEIYERTIINFKKLINERIEISRRGGSIWSKVDVIPIYSSTLCDCIENKKDYIAGGARYRDDVIYCFGFPNIVDSLLAIKELCYESKKYTLSEFLKAMRSNWEGYETMRQEAIACHGWGDDSDESNALGARLNHDLYEITSSMKGTFGGRVMLAHLTYTEVRFWGEKTLATPDGRKNGEYFAQGLTPSRLKKIPSALSVIHAMSMLDASEMAGNSVVNVILPSTNMSLDICESFLRATARSAVQSLQLNVFTKEELLDAQKHPEKYPHLIVRVTGFSAKFTSLSPEWQQEVITRNFYRS